MKKDEVKLKLFSLFEDIFNINKSKLKLSLIRADIVNWDSLGHVRLIVAIQKEFGIKIPWQIAANLKDVKSIIQYLANNIQKGKNRDKV